MRPTLAILSFYIYIYKNNNNNNNKLMLILSTLESTYFDENINALQDSSFWPKEDKI